MKNIKLLLTLIIASLIIWGVGKLYITYNLSRYAGYYVQQLPHKKGTKPELAIILSHLDYIETPITKDIIYDLDGNGAIKFDENSTIESKEIVLSKEIDIVLRNYKNNKTYVFNNSGNFSYYFTDNVYNTSSDKQYKEEAEAILDKILPPILEAQPKSKINLQELFNKKYYDRFN